MNTHTPTAGTNDVLADFTSLNLVEPLMQAVTESGYTKPTPIQAQSIPALLEGHDLLGLAQTGTGKTAAFTLPMLQRLMAHRKQPQPKSMRALILTPTRELAVQINDSIKTYGRHLPLRSTVIFGGVPWDWRTLLRNRPLDVWMHEQDIRESVARPAPDAALQKPEARLSLDEIETMMGFVVAKRGGAPDGARVEIQLTGPMARTIRVAVDGRAAVVPDFGGAEPTTVIRMDGWQFTRLCGGRPLGAVRPVVIEFEGDAEVGHRIVENLGYVI